MAIQNYKFEAYYDTGGGVYVWTQLTNMVSFTINKGRQAQLDQYNADTASCVFRIPTTTATLPKALVPGVQVRISNVGTGTYLFEGFVSDSTVEYGIPYNSGTNTANADFMTLTLEGVFAKWGRQSASSYAMAADTLTAQLAVAQTQAGLVIDTDSYGLTTAMPATTLTSTWGDWINRVLLTINGRLLQSGGLNIFSKYTFFTTSVNFSDTTNDVNNQVYSAINFHSLADNYYTQVTVTPESFGSATVQTGLKPFRTYTVNTINASTGQATDYANYLLNNYKTPIQRIDSVVCEATSQNSFRLDGLCLIAQQVSVVFRGTTYTAIVEGYTISGTPVGSRYTFYLSAKDLNSYLILNNTVFGKLDSNRLGY